MRLQRLTNKDRLTNQPRAFELSVSFIGLDIKSFKKIIQKVIKKKKKKHMDEV